MTSILEGPFPGWEDEAEVDLLGGIDDESGGYALAYFSELSNEDREIVQWYQINGIDLQEAIHYVDELVETYAIIDPERKAKAAIEMAQKEVQRVARYFSIFMEATDYWPTTRVFTQSLTDSETGEKETIATLGWVNECFEESLDISEEQEMVEGEIIPHLTDAILFLENPLAAPHSFNQTEILEDHAIAMHKQLAKQAELLLTDTKNAGYGTINSAMFNNREFIGDVALGNDQCIDVLMPSDQNVILMWPVDLTAKEMVQAMQAIIAENEETAEWNTEIIDEQMRRVSVAEYLKRPDIPLGEYIVRFNAGPGVSMDGISTLVVEEDGQTQMQGFFGINNGELANKIVEATITSDGKGKTADIAKLALQYA